jgi:CubicO group peptidase (beta-lactamase class C family)
MRNSPATANGRPGRRAYAPPWRLSNGRPAGDAARAARPVWRALLVLALSLGSVACGPEPPERAEAARLASTRVEPVGEPLGTEANGALGSALSSIIPDRMRADEVPGLNILVIRGGDVRWLASFGWADVASERPMTPDAMFRVESISKPVTAWGVMKLAESGVLDLDAPVGAQLRGWALPQGAASVTPRHLLSHTALIGLGYGWVAWTTGSIRWTILAHVLVDSMGVRAALFTTGMGG